MDCSVGIAQVRISTAKDLEDRGYMPKTGETTVEAFGETVTISREDALYTKLTDNKTNIRYAAAELKYRQDLWKEKYPEIDGRTAILATLYNRGDDAGTPHSNPQSNDFGNFAKDNYYHMRGLLGLY